LDTTCSKWGEHERNKCIIWKTRSVRNGNNVSNTDRGINRTILKWIIKVMRVWTGFICLKLGTSAEKHCVHKGGGFLDRLSDGRLLNKHCFMGAVNNSNVK
jgi:hypothetical protein